MLQICRFFFAMLAEKNLNIVSRLPRHALRGCHWPATSVLPEESPMVTRGAWARRRGLHCMRCSSCMVTNIHAGPPLPHDRCRPCRAALLSWHSSKQWHPCLRVQMGSPRKGADPTCRGPGCQRRAPPPYSSSPFSSLRSAVSRMSCSPVHSHWASLWTQ